jgi:hypothetical protein
MDMVYNATFNTISAISWMSVLMVEETGVPEEKHCVSRTQWYTQSQQYRKCKNLSEQP